MCKDLGPDRKLVPGSILKIPKINWDQNKQRRQLFGYSIAAKRYALYTKTDNDIQIVEPMSSRTRLFLHAEGLTRGPWARQQAVRVRHATIVTASAHCCELAPIYIGKESDRHWEEGEDLSLLEFKAIQYRRRGKVVVEDDQLARIARVPRRESCAEGSTSTRWKRYVAESL